ncbi:Mannan endo-1-6-alpha-mannosidase DCW1 [Penicillium diatomitis]|uniref:Mannan endo-1,6-alpha-mannosidase n=1 Tax=Penicillium diatomitis TaxID=2819901 RepID=A0A9W9XEH5_9EURO|nr:Mannan endo-1-6-alpha-mannosidase DCW1 [Penicillium diatomitis]KAJ5490746.1 Mannan endo-1-6-alpha-mannosidase DCW1 [Penicillium diatomitis]
MMGEKMVNRYRRGHPANVHRIKSRLPSAARRVAYDLVTFYTGNRTGDVPGNLPAPYYWWEAGAFFGALVNYWAFTGDATYNSITVRALEHQAGVKGDFMPVNQTYTEGNDDQSFWAMSAMMAAERNFPNPVTSNLGWLGMVQGVFNQQAHRWDNMSCSGGLRWQIYPWNAGYGYKNTISNGGFFDIAARLARYTGNVTYAEWADKVWDWSEGVGLITPDFQIFDGTTQETNCTSYDRTRWSYTGGIWLHGAAVMYNYTSSSSTTSPSQSSVKWKSRLDGLLLAANHFYQNDSTGAQVMHEPPCEHQQRCNTDQLSFKAYLSRWLADVIQLAPHTYYDITAKVRSTAKAAARQCQGGETGTYCGHRWSSGKYDGTIGVGQQMGVLEVLHGLLATHISGPLTASTGGTSEGNTSAGTAPDETEIQEIMFSHVTTGDRAGAAVLTVVFVGMLFSAVYTMVS